MTWWLHVAAGYPKVAIGTADWPEHGTEHQSLGRGICVLFQMDGYPNDFVIFKRGATPDLLQRSSKYSSQGPRARAHPALVARIQTDFLRSHFNRAWIQKGRW